MNKLIGILGGTFDPVHNGHLTIAKQLLTQLPFDHIRFIPCYLPVHRDLPGASATQRLQMLQLATQDESLLIVDEIEIVRQNPSFMVETLHSLKKIFKQNSLALIMGYDAWQHFTSWHQWQTILTLAHLILIHRPQYLLPEQGLLYDLLQDNQATSNSQLLNQQAGKILLQPNFDLSLSATQIRQAAKKLEVLNTLVPPTVADYIFVHKLYQ
ncbi:MAG: nicotinate (nicotinamide) nucleotide adenylyltransferase [Gammaproteobacteria bacterium RIFCSPHIGHO2_12_FULL_35_23]|nr:MAG: nicotinate (nicotinamide) nucleotide adenylyltransferase [Gammaproteobacteria bacterium RIFCSPHIGHO2_12_FULL_35_23]